LDRDEHLVAPEHRKRFAQVGLERIHGLPYRPGRGIVTLRCIATRGNRG
jgi:hypothetical protein